MGAVPLVRADEPAKGPHASLSPRPAIRSIPSLDGLRALSIAFVFLAHSQSSLPSAAQHLFRISIGNGSIGVAVFFVISGYLITRLLLEELDNTGTISLRRFYLRRSLRIFPPFYVFLAVMGGLWRMGIIPEDRASFIAAATYTWSYFKGAHGYFITHAWSLSIEEQFYLVWPAVLILARRRKAIYITAAIICLMPLVRVALYFLAPGLRGHEGYMLHGWIDTLMLGCLIALWRGNPAWEGWRGKYVNGRLVVFLTITSLFLLPYLGLKLRGGYNLAIGFSAQALCIGGVLVYLVHNAQSAAGRWMNRPVVRHVGNISYSLYLWQQLFTSPDFHLFPWSVPCTLAVAELSFRSIEQPSRKLSRFLELRLGSGLRRE
jgi:peptidoglycan/LPS O-acetylase OafA/YrhL